MNRSDTIGQLAAAMAKAQASMKPAGMNAVNPFLKNTYADLGAVIEAIRPVLAANGLAFTQLPTTEANTVTLETVIMHASGEWISSTQTVAIDTERGLSQAQITGKAITYLRRYALSAMFGVYADKDDDGNEAPKAERVDAATGEIVSGNGHHPPAAPITDGQRKRLHGLGDILYGPDWDTNRHRLVGVITKGRTQSSADLTEDEATRLIRGMEKKLDSQTVEAGSFPAAEDLHPQSAHQTA